MHAVERIYLPLIAPTACGKPQFFSNSSDFAFQSAFLRGKAETTCVVYRVTIIAPRVSLMMLETADCDILNKNLSEDCDSPVAKNCKVTSNFQTQL